MVIGAKLAPFCKAKLFKLLLCADLNTVSIFTRSLIFSLSEPPHIDANPAIKSLSLITSYLLLSSQARKLCDVLLLVNASTMQWKWASNSWLKNYSGVMLAIAKTCASFIVNTTNHIELSLAKASIYFISSLQWSLLACRSDISFKYSAILASNSAFLDNQSCLETRDRLAQSRRFCTVWRSGKLDGLSSCCISALLFISSATGGNGAS